MTYLTELRTNLRTLIAVYGEAIHYAPSTVCRVIVNEPKFHRMIEERDFRVGTYDFVTGRLAALWPIDLAWPANVRRPEPIHLEGDDEVTALISHHVQRREASMKKSLRKSLPAEGISHGA